MSLIDEMEARTEKLQHEHPEWRAGQAAWNALWWGMGAPDGRTSAVSTLLHGTSADCFHSDSKIPNFWAAVQVISDLLDQLNGEGS